MDNVSCRLELVLRTDYVSCRQYSREQVLTWILIVVSKQLRLLRGRVGASTTLVNSLSPQMNELVKDAVASCCGDIV